MNTWLKPTQWRMRLRQWRTFSAILRDLRAQPSTPMPAKALPIKNLLLLPSDPVTLIGARGDQAMMQAVVDELRGYRPDLKVTVATASDDVEETARSLGYEPLRIPSVRSPIRWLVNEARKRGVDATVLLGADMMDGHYSPVFTARSLTMADALARHGVRTIVLGFSFNDRPAPVLRPVFDSLSPATHLNVRDPISQRRFRSFTNARTTLVADAAFMLRPDDLSQRVSEVDTWALAQRQAGFHVLAFNVHPGLVDAQGPAGATQLIKRCADALESAAGRHKVRWLLLPHDYRDQVGDNLCLGPIAQELRARGVPVRHADVPLSASELKAIAGRLDGVITGRMHLAIATLGQAVPVACVTYQGKFEGLLTHFGLPDKLMLSPTEALVEGKLEGLIERFVEDLPASRERISAALPAVLEAARLNLKTLRPALPQA